jgi:hypothetical protein
MLIKLNIGVKCIATKCKALEQIIKKYPPIVNVTHLKNCLNKHIIIIKKLNHIKIVYQFEVLDK